MASQNVASDDEDRTCPIEGCDEDGTYRIVEENAPDPEYPEEDGWEHIETDMGREVYGWTGPTVELTYWYCEDHSEFMR